MVNMKQIGLYTGTLGALASVAALVLPTQAASQSSISSIQPLHFSSPLLLSNYAMHILLRILTSVIISLHLMAIRP